MLLRHIYAVLFCSVLGCVLPVQEVDLCQSPLVFSVLCCPCPYRSLLPHNVISPTAISVFQLILLPLSATLCLDLYLSIYLSIYLSRSLADRWGTTVDFTTSFLHSSRFSAFRSVMFHGRPVHSLMLSSRRFHCLPLRLPP